MIGAGGAVSPIFFYHEGWLDMSSMMHALRELRKGQNGKRLTNRVVPENDFELTQKYHQLGAVGSSDLRRFARHRRRFYEESIAIPPLRERDPPTPTQIMGNLIEVACLDPARLVAVPPEVMQKRTVKGNTVYAKAGKEYQEWLESLSPSSVIVTADEVDVLMQVRRSIARHKRVSRILFEYPVSVHVRVEWEDEPTELHRKAELDMWLPEQEIICDIKTSKSPLPGGFDFECWQWGYNIQLATYEEAMRTLGREPKACIIIAIGNVPPYEVELHIIERGDLDYGHAWNRRWMDRLAKTMRDKDWGPYTAEEANTIQRPRGFYGDVWEDERLLLS